MKYLHEKTEAVTKAAANAAYAEMGDLTDKALSGAKTMIDQNVEAVRPE